ncbi:MAG: hypothetical protein DRR19_12585 [Candidatus Parabeggiatoa sp. nov. 1]|nr:MAG: hypothetical protein DRR19_12585 [Gammaproteobacteria bacterium]
MSLITFESKLLPEGYLYCPKEFAKSTNARFLVYVVFEDIDTEATDHEVEMSALSDISNDFISQEELDYYLNLENL